MLKMLLKESSAYALLTVELRQASVKGATEGELSLRSAHSGAETINIKPVLKVLLKESSAYTLLTVELRQASVKGATEGELSLRSAHSGAETSQC